MIRHILFDFDGTIVRSMELAVSILNEMAEKYHYRSVTMEDIRELKSLPLTERFRKIGFPVHRIPAMAAESSAIYRRGIASLKPVEGIGEVLSELKTDGIPLAVLSSNSVDNITEFLLKNRMERFDHICSSNNLFGKDKSICKFIKKYGVGKDELIYVGDETRDIDACRLAGVKIIAVTWGYDPRPLLQSGKPDFIAETPEDIVNIIRACRRGPEWTSG